MQEYLSTALEIKEGVLLLNVHEECSPCSASRNISSRWTSAAAMRLHSGLRVGRQWEGNMEISSFLPHFRIIFQMYKWYLPSIALQELQSFVFFYHSHEAISNFSSTLNMEAVVPASPVSSNLKHKANLERVTFYYIAAQKPLSLIYSQGSQKKYSCCVLGLGDHSVFHEVGFSPVHQAEHTWSVSKMLHEP